MKLRSVILAILVCLVCALDGWGDTVHTSSDTNVNFNKVNQTNGSNVNLFVRDTGAGGIRHAFAQFDLSSLPTGEPVSKATLRFWASRVQKAGSVDLHLVNDGWDESTLTAGQVQSMAVTIDPIAFASVAITNADKNHYVSVDVTPQVQAWLDGAVDNHGLAILPNNVRAELDSKENGGTSHPLELEVVLEGPEGPTGPAGMNGVSGTDGMDGMNGAPGVPGQDGADGISGREIVQTSVIIPPGDVMAPFAECPAGKVPLGGGWFGPSTADIEIARAEPDNIAYNVIARNISANNQLLRVTVICASVSP